MSDKKQKEAMMKRVKQVIVVGACVLFVVLMILSGMGSGWLHMFTTVKPGDSIVVDYTLYDINGKPVVTSNQQVYTQAAQQGGDIIFSRQLSVITGQNTSKSIYPVQVYSSGGWTKQYALFSAEYDAINNALPGMKTGEQKRILLPNASMAQEWSEEQLTRNGVNIADLNFGDRLAMSVSDNPEAEATNNTAMYTRIGEITSKTNQSVIVDFGYPSAQISVVSINAKN